MRPAMTTTGQDLAAGERHSGRNRVSLVVAFATTAPGIFLRLTGTHVSDPMAAVLFGLAIVGSAFLLSWAAEVAQLDISAGLAIAVLAFIAVLPEYAVDLVFARKGGNAFEQYGHACRSAADAAAKVESPCSLALANMTGANRLLIGVGWSMVAFIAWYRFRKRGGRHTGIALERSHSVELAFLILATAYSLSLPLKRSISLIDAAVLVAIFVVYTVRISRAPAQEPHLVGPATLIAGLRVGMRRAAVVLLFLFAAGVILLCAEHFAEALVETGKNFNISEFLLVQWLAPLASEAPELLVAGLFAWRLNTSAGLGTLVSSKVNQWTLLVGTLPIAFALASGSLHGLPIIAQQREELLLTAAQSVFAVAILINLSMSNREAVMLFALFWAQFLIGAVVPERLHGIERLMVSATYLVLGVVILFKDRGPARRLLKDGFRTPYSQLDGP
jgi:cation:H+ antiporter